MVKVNLYEKNNIVGGMCRTWKWNDFLVDTGPHIYHTPDKLLENFWENEFGDFLIVMKLIRDERINTESLISNRISLTELPENISTPHKSWSACKTIILNEGLDATIKSYQRAN